MTTERMGSVLGIIRRLEKITRACHYIPHCNLIPRASNSVKKLPPHKGILACCRTTCLACSSPKRLRTGVSIFPALLVLFSVKIYAQLSSWVQNFFTLLAEQEQSGWRNTVAPTLRQGALSGKSARMLLADQAAQMPPLYGEIAAVTFVFFYSSKAPRTYRAAFVFVPVEWNFGSKNVNTFVRANAENTGMRLSFAMNG